MNEDEVRALLKAQRLAIARAIGVLGSVILVLTYAAGIVGVLNERAFFFLTGAGFFGFFAFGPIVLRRSAIEHNISS